jgi:Asp/Glu/hydantoin racemase
MRLRGGTNVCGIPIGILCLESYYPKTPGHVRNASTFDFPVMYRVIQGATPRRVVDEADPDLLQPFIAAARELEREGVLGITGSCGFLALFQRELADSVAIPMFVSSLIQVSMVSRMLKRDQKVGILTARKRSLTRAHLEGVGADQVPVCVAGMDNQSEFCEVVLEGRRRELDMDRLAAEVDSVVDEMGDENPDMGALVIECTDLPPFAHRIQQRLNLPVFDIVTLTNMVCGALLRQPYRGIRPREAGNLGS